MAKFTSIKTNCTAGEISPLLYGRVDLEKYWNGLESCLNCIPTMYGGARGRWGLRYTAAVKDHAKKVRLIPFVYDKDVAYQLEFGDLYVRFYKADGTQVMLSGSPYEIASPYAVADLPNIAWVQDGNEMYLQHPNFPTRRLRRFADNDWSLTLYPFQVEPSEEVGFKPAANLTLSGTTGSITVTASASVFLSADNGRPIEAGKGFAIITNIGGGTTATAMVTETFDATSFTSGNWTLGESPKAALTTSAKEPVGATVDLELAGIPQAITAMSYDATAQKTTATSAAHSLIVGNVVVTSNNVPIQYNGTYAVSDVPDVNNFKYRMSDPGDATAVGTWAKKGTGQGWRAGDVGKYVRMNGGLIQITEYVSASKVRGVILSELSSASASPIDGWSLQSKIWNSTDGYPRAIGLFEQRLIFGGTRKYPNGVWGSRSGNVFSLAVGSSDDDALDIEIKSEKANNIRHITATKVLLLLTLGGEASIQGGQEKPITPANRQIKDQSGHGASDVRTVRVDNEVLFAQRAGRRIRSLSYALDSDAYDAPDISVLSKHITKSGVAEFDYAKEPDSLLWFVRNDGKFISLTLQREQSVNAWAPHETDGFIESVSVIPNGVVDQAWFAVRRTINGLTRRYIERMEVDRQTDCCVVLTSGTPQKIWTGLTHLEGKSVDILADGVVMPQQIVTGGQITLQRDASTVEIGLHYEGIVRTLRLEPPQGAGTAQGAQVSLHEVMVRLHETIGCSIKVGSHEEVVPFRKFGEGTLDKAVEPFSGDKSVPTLGWEKSGGRVEVKRTQPLPFHVLMIARKCTVNEG